jgi:uncharacterized protein (DUF433 family)
MATSAETLRSVLVTRDPEIHSGDAVFAGTRVPVETLVDWLQGGDTIDDFLDNFPSVRREQVIAALELLRDVLESR